jgi:hypothetical protein
MRVAALLPAALLLAAACDRNPDPPAGGADRVAAACVSRPQGSRWVGEYRATSMFGDVEEEALGGMTLAGIAATDSIVYVMETQRAALWLLRPDLSVIRRIGREGDGPGEWRPAGAPPLGGSMRWVHASEAGVRLFDGQRIQELTRDGRFRRVLLNGAMEAGISLMQSRQAFVGDTLLYSAGGYDVMASIASGGPVRHGDLVDGRQPWWVRMRVGDEERNVLELGLTPLRKVTVGPAQARPLWDTNGACIAASDGAGPLLVHAPIGGRQDTTSVPLPDRADRSEDYADKMGGLLPPGTRLEEPSAPTRVRDLAIDPDGFVWLLPVQPADGIPGGVEVIRVPLGGGSAVTDTVPAFPRAFGGPGVYFAETRGPDGEILVVRYESAGTPRLSSTGRARARP